MLPDDSAPQRGASPVLSFGVFGDAHYAQSVYGDRHCKDSLDKLRKCIRTFNERGLSLAVDLGDSINASEDKAADLACLAEYAETCAEFRGERHHVLGNHDVETFTKGEFLQSCGITGARPHYSFDHGGVHFVVLDGNCHEDGADFAAGDFDWDVAWVAQAQLAWLANDLRAAQERPVVVLCHESLDYHEWEGGLDPHCVRNQADVQAVIESAGNVRAVIMGHYHHGRHGVQNGVPYVTLAAMCVGPAPQNNAYAVASLHQDGSVVVEGFGRQESYRVTPRSATSGP